MSMARIPVEWQWTLWSRARAGVYRDWRLEFELTQLWAARLQNLLGRLEPDREFVVCRPGTGPMGK